MFGTVEALDSVKHGSLTYKGVPAYAFARDVAAASTDFPRLGDTCETFDPAAPSP
jgi:hypothetical protein